MADILKELLGGASPSEFLGQAADGFISTPYLRDYTHASELMRPNGLALAPKHKFLFHVYFNINPNLSNKANDLGLVGALVKSVQLPTFSIDTEQYVQYNRKRVVQNRIKYEPVQIVLHDDGNNSVLAMWQKYYGHHFSDGTYPTNINKSRDLYQDTGLPQGWGKSLSSILTSFSGEPFFKDITIYSFNRGQYTSCTLVNPAISRWSSDTHDYSQSTGTMQHEMTIEYEYVEYGAGQVSEDNVSGFGNKSRYDTEPGALGPGSTTSLAGQGGLLDSFGAIGKDLASGNVLGAIRTAGASAKTFGSIDNLKNVVVGDAVSAIQGKAINAIGTLDLSFPKPADVLSSAANSVSNASASLMRLIE